MPSGLIKVLPDLLGISFLLALSQESPKHCPQDCAPTTPGRSGVLVLISFCQIYERKCPVELASLESGFIPEEAVETKLLPFSVLPLL